MLAEQHDEWTEIRRYIGLEILAKSHLTILHGQATTLPATITA